MKLQFELKHTEDYSTFGLSVNRSVSASRVRTLIESIKKEGLQVPIVATRRGTVVDGQHRLAALMELGYPVPYLVSTAWKGHEHTAVINNSQKSWNTENWAEFRASQGNKTVQEALTLASEYKLKAAESGGKITLTTALEMISANASNVTAQLKNNTFKYDREIGDEIFDMLLIIAEHPSGMKNSFNQKMVRALKMLKADLGYINKKAIARMAQRNFIQTYNNEGDMYKYIKKIYNQSLKK